MQPAEESIALMGFIVARLAGAFVTVAESKHKKMVEIGKFSSKEVHRSHLPRKKRNAYLL